VRIGAAVLSFVCACSFPHGSLGQQPGDDAGTDADGRQRDAAIDSPPDAPPDAAAVVANLVVTQDTYVDSQNDLTAYGTQPLMLADGGGQDATSLFRADMSAIPTTATVQSAVLHIWVSNDVGADVSLYRMLESWDEANATWTERAPGTSWSSAGAAPPSSDTTALATLTPDVMYAEKTATIPANVVQEWVASPAKNFGLAIKTTSSDGSTWRTRENAALASHPYFLVTYLAGQ
jgi:hypothetical protein